MKIKYQFITGETTEVEVSSEIGAVIINSRREEESANRKHRRHCWSIDAKDYEGLEYADPRDFTKTLLDDSSARSTHITECLSKLSMVQRRRLLMLARGLSFRQIARLEGRDVKTIRESIEAARKIFKKHFKYPLNG